MTNTPEYITRGVIDRCADCDVCRHLMDVNCLLFPELFRNLLKRGAYYATEYQAAVGAPLDMILKPENEQSADGTPRFSQFKKSMYGKILKDDGMFASISALKRVKAAEHFFDLGEYISTLEKAPDLIVTDCLSCRLQFEQFTPFAVKHPIELL